MAKIKIDQRKMNKVSPEASKKHYVVQLASRGKRKRKGQKKIFPKMMINCFLKLSTYINL